MNMDDVAMSALRTLWKLPDPVPIWQWAARNVDYSRVPAYDTPIKGPYDSEYMPFWKEPMDAIQADDVREIDVLKNSRAGYSENMCLIPMRWLVAQNPARAMYLTGDQTAGERFMSERIKRGMGSAIECRRALKLARSIEHEIQFEGMDFRVSWPRSRMAFKQDGWEYIWGDEADTWPEYSFDMLKKRCDTYPFHKIIFGSSIDPQRRGSLEASPILTRYNQSDKREWMMPDPATGQVFRFQLGDGKGAGIGWDKDAKNEDGGWNLRRVRETAHYLTPDGTRIEEADRMAVVRAGRWQATADGAPWCRGYRITQPMVPFSAGRFGEIAVAFLSAKSRGGQALRTYFAEYWAEVFYGEKNEADENSLANRERDYKKGEPFWVLKNFIQEDGFFGLDEDQRKIISFMTIDVHKDWFQWVVRQWREPGESALIDYGIAPTFEQLRDISARYSAAMVFDNHYTHRAMEVLDFCFESGATPLLGSDRIELPYSATKVDPYEGKRGAGSFSVVQYTWNVHIFRNKLMAAMRGETPQLWAIPGGGVDRDYIRQVTSTELKDGVWDTKKGQSQDHVFDCEAMQFVAAAIAGVCR